MRKMLKASGALCGAMTAAFGWSSLTAIPEDASAITATINITLDPVIAINVEDDILDFNITPSASGVFSSNTTNVGVNTNSATGYTLTLATSGDETALVSDDTTINSKIAGLSSAVSEEQFENNAWGYLASDSLYHAIPANGNSGAVLNQTSSFSAGEDVSVLNIGTKINSQITSGSYKNTVVLTAVANP